MSMFQTKDEIQKDREDCQLAYNLSWLKRGKEQLQLRYKSFPYVYRCETKDQYLSVCIDQNGNFSISDLGGFLTFVETIEGLAGILHDEAKTPGALRELLTGKNTIREEHERQKEFRKKAKTSKPKVEISLDDLELTI